MIDLSQARLPPFAHQVIGVTKLVEHPFFFLADDMGLGKSKQVIDAAQVLYTQRKIDRVIVIAPGAVRAVWFDPVLSELKKHLWENTPSAVKQYHAKMRVWRWPHDDIQGPRLCWLITNYEFIRTANRLKDVLEFCTPHTLLICDESSFIKSHSSAQTKACMKIRKKCGRVWLLNGTPISHSPLDMFSQGNILHPGILECPFVTHYKSRYAIEEVVKRGNGVPMKNPRSGADLMTPVGWKNLDDLTRRFKPYILRRLRGEVMDLPKVLPVVPFNITLEPETWRIYKEMRNNLVAYFQGKTNEVATAANGAVKSRRLSQITSGFVGGVQDLYDEDRGTSPIRIISAEKINFAIKQFLEWYAADPTIKVIIWTVHRVELFRLIEAIAQQVPDTVARGYIYGGQKPAERAAALELLDPRTAPPGAVIWAGVTGTGSFGINLTASHTVFDLSFQYSPGPENQKAARVDRYGQLHSTSYFDAVAYGPNGEKTIDHIIAAARREREDIANWTHARWINALQDE